MAAMLAVLDPGDEIVVFEPFYENYGPDAILTGAVPRYVTLHEPDWSIDPDELRAAFGPRTRGIVLNSPHNPTGKAPWPSAASSSAPAPTPSVIAAPPGWLTLLLQHSGRADRHPAEFWKGGDGGVVVPPARCSGFGMASARQQYAPDRAGNVICQVRRSQPGVSGVR